ncbi:chemotaxis protein CheA [Donghicola sp. C2-DW-16]|uniref:Chemotaxis protein CheA n=1 Tax=Donghicola mangrovi TaxID=2729614 RepID=A0ABX2PJ68_9RHOB|nr:chemotaxis protein CheA [Donghicola mangrovi]NVO28896.1 chemotaxis protein CheA [Donghicola mangrovi]
MSNEVLLIFLEELRELKEQFDTSLLSLRKDFTDQSSIDGAFRALHTIKGSGAMCGLTQLSEFAHAFETLFDEFRKGNAPVNQEVIRLSFEASDLLPDLVNPSDITAARSAAILSGLANSVHADEGAGAGTSLTKTFSFRLKGKVLELGANPALILQELRELGATEIEADTSAVPGLDDLDPETCYIGWHMKLPADVDEAALNTVFLFFDVDKDYGSAPAASGTPAQPARPPAGASASSHPKAPAAQAEASIRVGTSKLDSLVDQVGELVIAEARLSELARLSKDPNLLALAEQINRLSLGLRDTAMSIRMVPFGTLASRFERLVADLCMTLSKDVTFEVIGRETELDKTMIEKLADPLVHIIRNSMDHGIEPAEIRTANGKKATGSIQISAEHIGSEVIVTVKDDGKGLDADRIHAKAIEKGILSPDEAVSQDRLFNLIFEPAFSTQSQVSELSGRGVGMDVVKKTIDGLRGKVDVQSTAGKGTEITLRLPLTLAIVEGLLIEVDHEKYTIPVSIVNEIVDLPADKYAGTTSSDFLNVRGDFVPFVRLRKVLGCPPLFTGPQVLIVISASGEHVGIVVDRIIGKSQTVIKQMSPLHEDITQISGATILGDGTVALILDPIHLIEAGREVRHAIMSPEEVSA